MKTQLPESISNIKEAEKFLAELINNGEIFHPEDNAHEINWSCEPPTFEECDHLNKLMEDIYTLENFDPCGYIIDSEK